MRNEIQQELIDVLRSGEYKQGRGQLRIRESGEFTFCCLGVACDLYAKRHPGTYWRDDHFIYEPEATKELHGQTAGGLNGTSNDPRITPIKEELALARKLESELILANDSGKDFNFIADRLEEVWA